MSDWICKNCGDITDANDGIYNCPKCGKLL